MKSTRRGLVVAATAAALAIPTIFTNYAAAQPNSIAPEQMPGPLLGYAGFQRTTDAFREIDPAQVMYPSACAPATVPDQYSTADSHRGRAYEVAGFAAHDVTGPAGEVGADVYSYDSTEGATGAFDRLRSLFDRQCPLDHEAIGWEFLRESPITGTGSPYAPHRAFTATAGNDALGARTSVTFSVLDDYVVAAGYRVETSDAPQDPGTSADIADQAARAALEAVVEHSGG